MSVYKEGFHALSLIEKHSKQIYSDACDYGALVCKGDDLWLWTKQLVEMYGEKNSRIADRYATGSTVQTTVSLLDEWSTGDEFLYQITYVGCTNGIKHRGKKYDGYVYARLLKRIPGGLNLDA